jgi:large subunit ribosomal protein L3
MGRKQGPRKGSLQVWPRKRSHDLIPRTNWKPILARLSSHLTKSTITNNTSTLKTNFLGFIGYKAGMASAYVKDNTADSMTKNKRVIVPVTVIECPPMKILAVRFYKNGVASKEILNEILEKELKRTIRMPKNKINAKELLDKVKLEDFDDLHVVVYSDVKKTGLKKTPDIAEIALSGSKQDKLDFIKANLTKDISVSEVFSKGLIDIRGITKGKGFEGPIQRFGARLRFHKSEKGVRKIGSVGAWHPIGIRFRVPMAGQMGFHTRMCLNSSIVASKKFDSKDPIATRVFAHYGNVKNDYIILRGSVQGSEKRQLLMTTALRPSKNQVKKNYELIELR